MITAIEKGVAYYSKGRKKHARNAITGIKRLLTTHPFTLNENQYKNCTTLCQLQNKLKNANHAKTSIVLFPVPRIKRTITIIPNPTALLLVTIIYNQEEKNWDILSRSHYLGRYNTQHGIQK
ncbi:hypothetical protein GQX74_011235 [Glossina fuscipes]|nr:hypothetical protein GQX74_011235 [Glossina fuscipes]